MTEDQAKVEPITVKTSPISPTQKGMGIFSRLLSFSPLGPKTENPVQKSPKEEEPSQVYYGVYIPCESKIGADEGLFYYYIRYSRHCTQLPQSLLKLNNYYCTFQ